MKKLFGKYGLLALGTLLCACTMQGCYIDGEGCRTEERCSVGSDLFGNIVKECDIYEYCPGDTHYVNDYDCRHDWDCARNAICVDGLCVERDLSYYNNYGYVQACGFCTDTGQCATPGSACTLLASGEQVCTIPCSDTFNHTDCPNGYECHSFGQPGNMVTQCLPINNSCDPNYCDSHDQCVEYDAYGPYQVGSCVNHRCVANYAQDNCMVNDCRRIAGNDYPICYLSSTNDSYCTKRCYHDIDCSSGKPNAHSGYACALTSGGYDAMDSGVCVVSQDAYCRYSSECPDGLTCVSGRCTISCVNDWDCANSSGYADYYCAGGYCRMTSYQQWVNW